MVRQEDVWFIKFDGEEYGPYQSEREAMLFAVDAAHKLGEQGEETQVLQMDENGVARRCGPTGSTLIRLAYKARSRFHCVAFRSLWRAAAMTERMRL